MTAVLLDTCAAIWLNEKEAMTPAAVEMISVAARGDGVFVSPVTAWEVGLLAGRPANRPIAFHPDVRSWFARLMAQPAIRIAPLTMDIALESTNLPGEFHRDPADRFLIATARAIGATLVTRDDRILDYAKAGHARAIAC